MPSYTLSRIVSLTLSLVLSLALSLILSLMPSAQNAENILPPAIASSLAVGTVNGLAEVSHDI